MARRILGAEEARLLKLFIALRLNRPRVSCSCRKPEWPDPAQASPNCPMHSEWGAS